MPGPLNRYRRVYLPAGVIIAPVESGGGGGSAPAGVTVTPGTVSPYSYRVYVDWDNDGSFTTAGDEITSYVQEISLSLGISDPEALVAEAGQCSITLKNTDRRFSPAYTGGPLYGKLVSNLPVKVTMSSLTTTWVIFRGYTRKWTPATGALKSRQSVLDCVDLMTRLQDEGMSLPLTTDITGDTLVKHILNTALKAPAASGSIVIASGNASNNDYVTINGSTYTFKTTLSGGADEIKIGATASATASNLAALLNRDTGAGTAYSSSVTGATAVSGSASAGTVYLTSQLRGAVGNGYSLVKSGANLTVSGATLSGGSDYPTSPASSLEAGILTFDMAGDQWSTDDTNAMAALNEVVESERGYFWIARDGTPTFKNQSFPFIAVSQTAQITIDSEHTDLDGALDHEEIYNRVEVEVTPRGQLSSGVLAKSNAVITVPGQSGTQRWNGTVELPGGGNTTVKLKAVDPATGKKMGIYSATLPLTPSTDWTANDMPDGSGFSYTGASNLSFSFVVNGDSIEISIANNALGPLYLTSLQVRGIGLTIYDPLTVALEDTTSQGLYGKRVKTIKLPLVSSDLLARSIARYILERYKNPAFRVESITFDNTQTVNGVELYSLEIGDMLILTDYQTGITNQRYLITGIAYPSIRSQATGPIEFFVRRLDDVTYWILGDSAYGVLNTTTRLAI